MAVFINGVRYEGRSVSITNGVVTIDGVVQNGAKGENGILKVKVEGTLAEVRSDVSVECGDVAGNVTAGGSVQHG